MLTRLLTVLATKLILVTPTPALSQDPLETAIKAYKDIVARNATTVLNLDEDFVSRLNLFPQPNDVTG